MTFLESGVERIFECSSQLIKSLSEKESIFHRHIVEEHVESLLNNPSNIMTDFESGLEWINVTNPLSLRDTGKITVLDFFTYCCVNCIHILPQLKELESKYSIEDGVIVIGVHSPKFSNEHSTDNVRAAVNRYGITHPVVNDPEDYLWNILGIYCWPTLVVIGPSNQLLLYLMGETHQQVLNLFVKEALKACKERDWISNKSLVQFPLLNNNTLESRQLHFPGKVTATEGPSGVVLAVADTANHRVLIINDAGHVQHIVGCGKDGLKDGKFDEAHFQSPQGLVFKDPSVLFVADTNNHAVRKVDLATQTVDTVVGTGCQGQDLIGGQSGKEQPISSPWDLAFLDSSILLIAMAGSHQIWAYFLDHVMLWKKEYAAGTCAAVVGSGREENRNNSYPLKAGLAQPSGLTVYGDGHAVYVADSESSTIRAISTESGQVTCVVGGLPDPLDLFAFGDLDGKGQGVKLQHPLGVAWSDYKHTLYICDSYNHKVKMVNPTSRECFTVCDHKFNEPGGLCAVNSVLYIADTNNHCIKAIDLDTMSVRTISIKNDIKVREQITMTAVREVQVTICSDGGLLGLRVCISPVSQHIKPLTAQWTLTLPEGWQEATTTEDVNGLEMSWEVTVAPGKNNHSCRFTAKCTLLYCKYNLCSRQIFPFLFTVTYDDSAPSNVTSPVIFYDV